MNALKQRFEFNRLVRPIAAIFVGSLALGGAYVLGLESGSETTTATTTTAPKILGIETERVAICGKGTSLNEDGTRSAYLELPHGRIVTLEDPFDQISSLRESYTNPQDTPDIILKTLVAQTEAELAFSPNGEVVAAARVDNPMSPEQAGQACGGSSVVFRVP